MENRIGAQNRPMHESHAHVMREGMCNALLELRATCGSLPNALDAKGNLPHFQQNDTKDEILLSLRARGFLL